MRPYQPIEMLPIFLAARDFVTSISDQSEYHKQRKEIVGKFYRMREENQLFIAKHEDIHGYLRNLASEEVKLASLSRRLKANNNDEDFQKKSEVCEWFKEQKTNELEEKFGPYLYTYT